jgi:glycosyltransferase involved in cell wall biosynthesis
MEKNVRFEMSRISRELYQLSTKIRNPINIEQGEKELQRIHEEIKEVLLSINKKKDNPLVESSIQNETNLHFAKTSRSPSEQPPVNLKRNSAMVNNEQYEINIKNNHHNRIKVSIIMPTYNKYNQLYLSLYGLSKQTFSHIDYEVILIDDCSTDETQTLFQEADVSFKLKYIRLNQNKGRSITRNIGIKHSEGEVLIFLDGEMLVPPQFIENHYRHHEEKVNLVVTGAMHYEGVYTYIFREYNTDQWVLLDSLVKNNSEYLRRYEEYQNSNNRNKNEPYQLVTKDDMDQGNFSALSFPNRYFLNSGVKHFENNLSEFKLPYIAFLSGNVSVRREQLDKVGYFDESFVGYGAEDWEIGYRLYKNGLQFVLDPMTVAYHQEHPISPSKVKEQWGNHYRLIKKHPNMDILILALEWRGLSFLHMHETLVEYEKLDQQFPQQYEELKKAFQIMLFRVIEYLNEGKPVTKLYELPHSSEEKNNIHQQFSSLRPLGFHYLASSFEQLYLL